MSPVEVAKVGDEPAPRACAARGAVRPLGVRQAAKATKPKGQKRSPGKRSPKRSPWRRPDGRRPDAIPRPLRTRRTVAIPRVDVAKTVLLNLRTVVVNLDRRPDRMEGCATRLRARCPGLTFARLSATDGRATPISASEVAMSWHTSRNVRYQKIRSMRKGWDDLDTYHERTLPLSPGERGCASSHIHAWRHCLESAGAAERPLLVLEDDAAPTAEFAQVLARALASLPSDANLLYLGYSQAADWRRQVSAELVEAEYVWTTVGYIIWPSCARALLDRLPVNEPVDNWMAGLCAQGTIKAYCVRPKIVLQADAWNVNSDVAHSDEHYWGPCSDIQHTDADPFGAPLAAPVGSCLLGEGGSDSEDSDADM